MIKLSRLQNPEVAPCNEMIVIQLSNIELLFKCVTRCMYTYLMKTTNIIKQMSIEYHAITSHRYVSRRLDVLFAEMC